MALVGAGGLHDSFRSGRASYDGIIKRIVVMWGFSGLLAT